MPTIKEVEDAFKPFINKWGMLPFSNSPPSISDNDVLFTAYAIMAIEDACGIDTFIEWTGSNLKKSYEAYLRSDGATLRTPDRTDLDSNDNLIGWGVAAYFLKRPVFAESILSYARHNAWIWPGDEPITNRWLGRHRATEAHLQLAAGETPDFVTQVFWCIAVVVSYFSKNDADAFSLSYCMVRLARAASKTPVMMNLVGWGWIQIQKARGMTMKKNLEEVYGWPGSPHAKYII